MHGTIYLIAGVGLSCLLLSCTSTQDIKPTIASLSARSIPLAEDVIVQESRRKAIQSYRKFLAQTKKDQRVPEAMRRLADLHVEQSDEALPASDTQHEYADDSALSGAGYQESIALYESILRHYPDHSLNDRVLYQLARAYEHRGETDKALSTLDRLVKQYPKSAYYAEAQFRRGEILFVEKEFYQAELAYDAVLQVAEGSRYYEHAQYKKGWSLFKQNNYPSSLDTFMGLLQRKLPGGTDKTDPDTLPRAERELLDDALRVMSLSFSYQSGATSLSDYFNMSGRRPYEDLVYGRLGDMHLSNERYSDAAQIFEAFVDRNTMHHKSPLFQMKAIESYRKGRFPSLVLSAKKSYVKRFQLKGAYWQHNDPVKSKKAVTYLEANLTDLARHYHAQAQRTRSKTDYQEAIAWYRAYLESFPQNSRSPEMNFLLAEILFETKQFQRSATEYERTAYHYKPHARSAEAGYAALVAYEQTQKYSKGSENTAAKNKSIDSALRFTAQFPKHPKAAGVLTKASEDLFTSSDLGAANSVARRMIQTYPDAKPELHRTAWIVIAHCAFDSQDYVQAESAYHNALNLYSTNDKHRPPLEKKLAASVYKQGEAARNVGDLTAAVDHFLRLGKVIPKSSIRPTAEYDAAAALMELKDWRRAVLVLTKFRKVYPKHELQPNVTHKLAVAYLQSGQGLKAAAEFERMAQNDRNPAIRREVIWQAAELYSKGGDLKLAIKNLKRYVKTFSRPIEQAIEARQQLAQLYGKQNKLAESHYWLNELIKADMNAGKEGNARTRFLAANAALTLAKPAHEAYHRVKLVEPLKRNLKRKKRRMEEVLAAYGKAADYGIEQVTTASTYRTASIYQDFSQALLESERPKELSGEALEQYDILLEEQAYPFEEKAIQIHEVNVQRIAEGVYDEWVRKSMAELAEIMPIRYAKAEQSELFVEAIY